MNHLSQAEMTQNYYIFAHFCYSPYFFFKIIYISLSFYEPTMGSIKIHETLDQIINANFEFVCNNIETDKSLVTEKGSKQVSCIAK